MLIEEAIREFLLRSPAVKDRVGFRIYPEAVPEGGGFPRIVLELSGATPGQALLGDTGQPIERWNAVCEALGYDEARLLADDVEEARGGVTGGLRLKEYRRWMPPRPSISAGEAPERAVWVQSCRVTDRRGGEPEQQPGGAPKPSHKVTLELTIAYKRGA